MVYGIKPSFLFSQLREVALKLKKSVLEKSQEIERLKSENTKAIEKSQNLSTIQHQFDMALDEVEKYKSLEVSLQKDLQASIRENIGLKESNFELQSQVKVNEHNFEEVALSYKLIRNI